MLALKLMAVFLMGTAVGMLYRIPRSLLLYGSLAGCLAWGVFQLTVSGGGQIVFASFMASLAVGIFAELLARILRKPATIFIIPGFIPLVPGREAYATMVYIVEGRYELGMAMAVHTILTAGAIAFGIFSSSTIYRLINNYKARSRQSHAGKNKKMD